MNTLLLTMALAAGQARTGKPANLSQASATTGNLNIQESSIHNEGAHYENIHSVNNVSYQNISQENAAYYDGDRNDVQLIEWLSIFIIKHLGESRARRGGVGATLVGILLAMSYAYGFPAMLSFLSIYQFYVAILLVLLGVVLLASVMYRHDSRCPNCKEFYALKEKKDPSVREVTTRDGVRRKITRTLTCKACNAGVTRVEKQLIPDD